MYELVIVNQGNVYFPSVIEPITWEQEIKGSPSKLSFTVIKGQKLNFQEGNAVRLKYNDKDVFFGYVFTKKRDKQGHISVIAYDQMRYLKNKDTLLFENKSVTEIISKIADINNIKLGPIDDTGLKIKSLLEDNTTYLDMIYNALDITLTQKNKMYVLYDDFGKLTLKDIESMKVENFILSDSNMEDFDYTSSIDEQSYNQIKLVYENEESGKREVYIAKDSGNINKWGLLQFFESIDENTNGKLKADTLLEMYNRKTRKLQLKKVFGNTDVKAGFRVMTMLNLGDIVLQNYLIVSSVKHNFEESNHTMDITLMGGDFLA